MEVKKEKALEKRSRRRMKEGEEKCGGRCEVYE
jgi:hypothetical protein